MGIKLMSSVAIDQVPVPDDCYDYQQDSSRLPAGTSYVLCIVPWFQHSAQQMKAFPAEVWWYYVAMNSTYK